MSLATSSASAICGIAFGWTKLTASMRPTPVPDNASISATLASVGTGASFCSAAGGPPGVSPTLPPIAGMRLLLGRQVALDEVEPATGVAVRLPKDSRLGRPDSVWIDPAKGDQVAYVWKSSGELPQTLEPGVGLVLMRFDGRNDDEFYDKAIHSGTTLERVKVAGHAGYWISGDPHFFFYTAADGRFVEDSRRWVGDALIWNDGTATYRIESGLGRDATI